MEYSVALGLGVLSLAVGMAVLRIYRSEKKTGELLDGLLRQHRMEVLEAFQKQAADTSERIARASSEVRQELTKELIANFQTVQERIDNMLLQGRRELQEGLARSTQALEARFTNLQEVTRSQLEAMRGKIDERLEIIGQQVQSKLDQNLREGFQHMEKVQEHLKAAELQLQGVGQVGASIKELSALLRLPHLRGGFGEATLERLLSDFLPSHMFELQATVPGVGRVDALVKFPRASLPIDSKFPREQVLPLFEEASSPDRLSEARKVLAQVLKNEALRISKYIRPEAGTMNMALMFLPSETLYFEAIRDGKLWEEFARRKVHPVSPNTLAITLRGIAIAHEYYQMAKGVERTMEEIQKAKRHFEHFQQRFEEVGKGLEKAQEAFRTAATHLARYTVAVAQLSPSDTEDRSQPLPK